MSSIKYNSDLTNILKLLAKNVNLNLEIVGKQFKEEAKEESNESEDFMVDMDYDDLDVFTRESDFINDEILNHLDDLEKRPKERIIKAKETYDERRFSKSTPRHKLREGIIWSEILGPPVSKRRHNSRKY